MCGTLRLQQQEQPNVEQMTTLHTSSPSNLHSGPHQAIHTKHPGTLKRNQDQHTSPPHRPPHRLPPHRPPHLITTTPTTPPTTPPTITTPTTSLRNTLQKPLHLRRSAELMRMVMGNQETHWFQWEYTADEQRFIESLYPSALYACYLQTAAGISA